MTSERQSPSEDEPITETVLATPVETASYLTGIMRGGNGVKQSDKVHAAAGLMSYFLAHEIASLIDLLTTPQPEEG